MISIAFFEKLNSYDITLGIYEDLNFSNQKRFRIDYFISKGDGLLSGYRHSFHIDSTKNLHFKFNQDSTELEGKIVDLTLTGGHNKHLPDIPDKVLISEGSFRIRLIR